MPGWPFSVTPQPANADVVLVELRITSTDPLKALAEIAAALGSPIAQRDPAAERIARTNVRRGTEPSRGFRVIPLIHLPDIYGVSPRVKGGPRHHARPGSGASRTSGWKARRP
jgi:hypothetical protein